MPDKLVEIFLRFSMFEIAEHLVREAANASLAGISSESEQSPMQEAWELGGRGFLAMFGSCYSPTIEQEVGRLGHLWIP